MLTEASLLRLYLQAPGERDKQTGAACVQLMGSHQLPDLVQFSFFERARAARSLEKHHRMNAPASATHTRHFSLSFPKPSEARKCEPPFAWHLLLVHSTLDFNHSLTRSRQRPSVPTNNAHQHRLPRRIHSSIQSPTPALFFLDCIYTYINTYIYIFFPNSGPSSFSNFDCWNTYYL